MTPAQLTGLGVLVIEFRDWLRANDAQETVEQQTCDYLLDVIRAQYRRLVEEGAK